MTAAACSPCRSRSSPSWCSSSAGALVVHEATRTAPARRADRRHPRHRRRRLRRARTAVARGVRARAGGRRVQRDGGGDRGRRRGPRAGRAGRRRRRRTPRRPARRSRRSWPTMSHEIRTPMIGVTGMLEVLAQGDLTPPAAADGRHGAELGGRAAPDHRRHARLLEDRGRQARDRRQATSTLRDVVEAAVATFLHTASAKGLLPASPTCDDRSSPRPTSATRSASARSSATSCRTP